MTTTVTDNAAGSLLPRSIVRWLAVGLLVGSYVVIIISLLSGVTLSDFVRLGFLPFGLAAVASSVRLLVQVLRFRVVLSGLPGGGLTDLRGSAVVRMGSEFVSLATPAMIGGLLIRAAWLSKKGVDGGKAVWIGYLETLMDVCVGAALAFIAAAFAFSKGAVIMGTAIGLIAGALAIGYIVFFLVPALRGGLTIPRSVFTLASLFVGEGRARRFESKVQERTLTFAIAARAILRKDALPLILKVLALTIVDAVLAGLALWFLLISAGMKIDLFSSTFLNYGVGTIGAIPISVGGSGLTELTMQSYISSVYGFSSWATVVIWRLASYQFVLAISGVAFLLLLRRSSKYLPAVTQSTSLSSFEPSFGSLGGGSGLSLTAVDGLTSDGGSSQLTPGSEIITGPSGPMGVSMSVANGIETVNRTL